MTEDREETQNGSIEGGEKRIFCNHLKNYGKYGEFIILINHLNILRNPSGQI